MTDEATRATNDDATSCKKSAVERGYWRDPYIKFFCRSSERKAPEINRGYYARVAGVQDLLQQFLKATKCECQVINLGAGFDTTFWNLKDNDLCPRRFIELDFRDVTSRKCHAIKTRKELLEKLQSPDGEIRFDKSDLHSDVYHVVSCDLRHIDDVANKLQECGCDLALPTCFLAECVLVYMPHQHSSALLKWISTSFSTPCFINYEQVNMRDRFGEVMVGNLRSRGCVLAGLEQCASVDTQQHRFVENGWQGARALDMNAVYRSLPQADVQRIERLEFLDETEMLQQLFDHYCLCWAYQDPGDKHGLASIQLGAPTG